MPDEHSIAYVSELPMCDYCKKSGVKTTPAQYDAVTTYGNWAYMCYGHFLQHGVNLGMGYGQRLIVKDDTK